MNHTAYTNFVDAFYATKMPLATAASQGPGEEKIVAATVTVAGRVCAAASHIRAIIGFIHDQKISKEEKKLLQIGTALSSDLPM